MARLTVRLPDSLHEALERRAREEGVSKNRFIVCALSQVTAVGSVAAQRAAYARLLERLERLGDDEAGRRVVQRFLQARERGGAFLPDEAAPAAGRRRRGGTKPKKKATVSRRATRKKGSA